MSDCSFADEFGTHADMTGDGVATCCDGGPVALALDDEGAFIYVLAPEDQS